ncbi:hypothetical protein Tco_0757970 [Tanacetum coccineum]
MMSTSATRGQFFHKTSVKKRKRWYWKDLELESDCDRSHLREMYLILNPNERDALETEMRSRDELAIMEVEFVDYKTEMVLKMEEFKTDLKKKEKNGFFLKSSCDCLDGGIWSCTRLSGQYQFDPLAWLSGNMPLL